VPCGRQARGEGERGLEARLPYGKKKKATKGISHKEISQGESEPLLAKIPECKIDAQRGGKRTPQIKVCFTFQDADYKR